MSVPQRLFSFVLACASSVIVARAQPQTTPSPEVRKLAVMVGKFTIEDELKAGFSACFVTCTLRPTGFQARGRQLFPQGHNGRFARYPG